MKKFINKNGENERQREIDEILLRTDESPTTSLFIGEEGDLETLDELKSIILGDADDPDTKYDLYYHGIDQVLRKELPKGSKYKEMRLELREEINTFLANGKRKVNGKRGADCRMGTLPLMEEAFTIIFTWRSTGANPAVLYNKFRDINKKKAANLKK